MVTVPWRGKPVWILNRTDDMLADRRQGRQGSGRPDLEIPYSMPLPAYCANEYRARADRRTFSS
jgi:ubiquinol-cytochrome c reductase iron-sulfur subunit